MEQVRVIFKSSNSIDLGPFKTLEYSMRVLSFSSSLGKVSAYPKVQVCERSAHIYAPRPKLAKPNRLLHQLVPFSD